MTRQQALELPTWEFENKIESYYRIDAQKTLNNLYATASGFGGGEGSQQLETALRQRIDMGIEENGTSSDSIEITEDMSFEDIFGFSVPSI